MTPNRSFHVMLRLIFALYSCLFAIAAASKWDKYSFYMHFMDFLPDLSLSFIICTVLGLIVVSVLWLIAYGLYMAIPKRITAGHFELIMTCIVLVFLIMSVKRVYYHTISFSALTGMSHSVTIILGGILVAAIIWFGRKYIEKILDWLDNGVRLLVWFFVVLLVFAVPFSIFKNKSAEVNYSPVNTAQAAFSDKKRPNIILVTWDATTASDMQLYGYERPTTPFISEWAKEAVLFNKVYSSSNWTTSSIMSLMTGQRVWTHRITYQAYYNPVPDHETNLPRLLKDSGYDLYRFMQSNYSHPNILGMDKYFLKKNNEDRLLDINDKWWFLRLEQLLESRRIAKEWIFNNNIAQQISSIGRPKRLTPKKPSEDVYNAVLEFAADTDFRKSRQPFFIWINTDALHKPYIPPKPFLGKFEDTENPASPGTLLQHTISIGEYKPERQPEVDKLRRRYDEYMLYSDRQFELFLSRLAKTIDMSNTIIIFSSDHGESFAHGFWPHFGPHLYEDIVHIPLIIKIPGESRGTVINMLVEQIDIAPTILELADIPVPEWMEGRSLLPLLGGTSKQPDAGNKFIDRTTLEPRPIFSMQFVENRALGQKITKGTVAVWDGDYKLIYYLKNQKKLLFNLKSDPHETQNIFQEKPAIAKKLVKLINDNLARANERTAQRAEK